jgi:UDP-2,3-diacylglucosamine pyrophosphatase LpxH
MGKYIVLSDLHLGQNGADHQGQYSLLSQIPASLPNEADSANRALKRLQQAIANFATNHPVTLIVTGDLLDLSLANLSCALADLACLLRKLPQVNRLVWVIGNHDHHVWSMHCEERNLLSRLRDGGSDWPETLRQQPDEALHRPTHAEGETLALFEKPLSRAIGRPLEVKIAYPAFRLALADKTEGDPNDDSRTLFYFTHGHLFGGLFSFLSDILEQRLAQFPKERVAATVNLSIADFIYWLLGQTGEGMGANGLMETIYTDLQKGRQSSTSALISSMVDVLVPEGVVDGIPDALERSALKQLAIHFLKKATHKDNDPCKSQERHSATLKTRKSAEKWAIESANLLKQDRVHFVYGHTHVADQHEILGPSIRAHNLGSWLIEPNCPPPNTQLMCIDDGDQGLTVECVLV